MLRKVSPLLTKLIVFFYLLLVLYFDLVHIHMRFHKVIYSQLVRKCGITDKFFVVWGENDFIHFSCLGHCLMYSVVDTYMIYVHKI